MWNHERKFCNIILQNDMIPHKRLIRKLEEKECG